MIVPDAPAITIRRRDLRNQAMADVHLFETRADQHEKAGELKAARECWDAAAAFTRLAKLAAGEADAILLVAALFGATGGRRRSRSRTLQ